MNSVLIYFYGRSDGACIKFGISNDIEGAEKRRDSHSRGIAIYGDDFNTGLAFVWGLKSDEDSLKKYFKKKIVPGSTEIINADCEVRGFIRFLRTKYFVRGTPHELEQMPFVGSSEWLPSPDRIKVSTELPLEGGAWGDVLSFRITDDDYYTNPTIISLVRDVMSKIDLDPASSPQPNTVIKATHIFTIAEDGIRHPWFGRVWLNAPFGKWDIWAPKVVEEIGSGRISELLLFATANTTTSQQFYPMAKIMNAHCVMSGRRENTRCWGPMVTSGGSGEGNMIYYWGPHSETFCRVFSAIGTTWIAFPGVTNGQTT